MKKLISWAIKIIPLITIWQGVTSGGARLGPFVDTAKVALTQYEVAQITKAVFTDTVANKGKVISPKEFPDFIRANFHNQYSVLAREITGDKEHDHSIDIWGEHFKLIHDENIGMVKIASAGPDGILLNKDDVATEFSLGMPRKSMANQPKKKRVIIVEETVPTPSEEVEAINELAESEENREPASSQEGYDEEGYDVNGYDNEGYDRDGYDQNGMHRNEKELSTSQASL